MLALVVAKGGCHGGRCGVPKEAIVVVLMVPKGSAVRAVELTSPGFETN